MAAVFLIGLCQISLTFLLFPLADYGRSRALTWCMQVACVDRVVAIVHRSSGPAAPRRSADDDAGSTSTN